MPRLTPVSWKKFEKLLLREGCVFDRQEGSHRIYHKKGLKRPIVVPVYGQIPLFVIRNNLRILGLSVEEYSKKINKR